MTGQIMWECECGYDNFIVSEDLLETNCVNEIEATCGVCGQCVTLDVNIRVLPRQLSKDSFITRILYRGAQ